MRRDGDRRRVLTEDERVLWTTVTKSIAPLRETLRAAESAGAAPPKPAALNFTRRDCPGAGKA